MKVSSSGIVDLTEDHAKVLALRWYFDVVKNARTPSYHNLSEEEVIPQAEEFYHAFREMFISDQPYEAARAFFSRYAEKQYRSGIPESEALYAFILMRRHIWLHADVQVSFAKAVEQQQAVESLNRTFLISDYAVHVISEKYRELVKKEVDEDIGSLALLRMDGPLEKFKSSIMALLLFGVMIVSFYYHAFLNTKLAYSHLFYLPIVLAAIWWGRRGVSIAVGMGVYMTASNVLFLKSVDLADEIATAVVFVFIAGVIAVLTEGLRKIEVSYRSGSGKPT